MTDQKPTAIEQALAAAGAEMTAALRESGLRIVAAAALGQVIAKLPDAARGMTRALPLDQRYALAAAVLDLHGIVVDELPESKLADQHHAEMSDDELMSFRVASPFASAYRDDLPRMHRQLHELDASHDQLRRIRDACDLLSATVAALMPQEGPPL